MIALASKIVGPGSWHLHVVGEVPPGVDPNLMEASVITSFAMIGSLLPYIRGQWVELHEEDTEKLKQRFARQLKIHEGQ